MAITYKSQGVGVSTETSGAALSPLCPATVDANDILLAHVFWEGTTTAPSTPANWTLLSGPHVIETTIARHWVFGKIAAGTEDGSAVAFGSPAVTTQRAARIYSFAGFVGGNITGLVTGFLHTSNANDPTSPGATTTEAGNLAILLVAQNDNNTFANFTGESGGDWVEGVAEYTAALTPGFSLGIQTCTPTGNPGTVTGGTDNTANDPAGVIGFQIRQDSRVNVTPGVGVVTVTGVAPTIQTPQNSAPGVGAVTITGFAPTVETPSGTNSAPGVGDVVVTGLAPTIQTPQNATAGLGSVLLTGFAPTIQTPQNSSPDVGQVIVASFAPTIQTPQNSSPGVGAVTIAGFAPTIVIPQNSTPGVGQVLVVGFAPTIQTPQSASPGVGELTVTGFAPTVAIGGSAVEVVPGLGELIITGYEPTVTAIETPIEVPEEGGGSGVVTLFGGGYGSGTIGKVTYIDYRKKKHKPKIKKITQEEIDNLFHVIGTMENLF